MTDRLRIINGRLIDPVRGIDDVVRDVCVENGRVVAGFDEAVRPGSVRTIDAQGLVIMPGGVDIHCHIASASVNRARMMLGEEHASHVHHCKEIPGGFLRGGSGERTPSTFITGYRYAALGYTTAIDAAVAPSSARHTHLQLHDTPNLDAGFFLLVGNHAKVIELIDRGDEAGAIAFIAQLLHQTGALGVKIVNPGGVASWRQNATHHTVETIDSPIAGTGSKVSARRILEVVSAAAQKLNLPHPPHVHCNRLGLPGNVTTTLDTLAALDGQRVHLTHLQFHAYGKSEKGDFTSEAAKLVEYIDAHPLVSADVGQVMFGHAMTITADTPLEYVLWQLTGKRATSPYVSIESELETGCGLMPIEYSDKNYLHSLQWAIGLELMLTAKDPWRMLLSTDHPNGGSFMTYPRIIAALMSKTIRDEQIGKANQRAMKNTKLRDIDREMTLSEIAILTRSGPARALGLSNKGHLGAGADADITLYDAGLAQSGDWQRMFESPRYVIKGGKVLVEDGELRQAVQGSILRAHVDADPRGERELSEWFDAHGSTSVKQFGIQDFEREKLTTVNRDAKT